MLCFRLQAQPSPWNLNLNLPQVQNLREVDTPLHELSLRFIHEGGCPKLLFG